MIRILSLYLLVLIDAQSVPDLRYQQCVVEEIQDVKRELTTAFAQILNNIPKNENQIINLTKQVAALEKENTELRTNFEEIKTQLKRLTDEKKFWGVDTSLPDYISHRSCYDWKIHGYDKSGIYLIDPDGTGIGDPPVSVFCDMVTGYTIIHHDFEEGYLIHCSGNSCFAKMIGYKATISQVLSLLEISDKCKQHVEIQCFESPLFKDGKAIFWWEDIHGKKQSSWSDSGCWCAKSNSCTIPSHMCNCDAALSERWLTDSGYITDASKLPIFRLSFGGRRLIKMRLTVGPLLCYGRKSVTYPKSCHELWQSGHFLSGYYHIGNPSSTQLVFCNMTQVLQKSYKPKKAGAVSVMFYAGLSPILKVLGPVKFDRVTINVGGGYDASSGVFTAPIQGIYLFHVKTHGFKDGQIAIKKNNVRMALYDSANTGKDWTSNSHPLMLKLKVGDKVSVELTIGWVHGNRETADFSAFTGFLLRRTDF